MGLFRVTATSHNREDVNNDKSQKNALKFNRMSYLGYIV